MASSWQSTYQEGARFILYPNTVHLVIIERAEDFNRDVQAFLQQ